MTIDGITVTGGRNGITGNSAPGLIVRNATVQGTGRNGITYAHGASGVVDGCTVVNNARDGVAIDAAQGTVINSQVGQNVRFGVGVFNGGSARIGIDNFNNAAGNVISANASNGIHIVFGSTALIAMNQVIGNGTSTDPAALKIGVNVTSATADFIGGNTISGNVISGNTSSGIYLTDQTASSPKPNTIIGNLIGVNAAANAVLGNGLAGIYFYADVVTIIGGANPGDGNIIGGNVYGIRIISPSLASSPIKGNFIGTNSTQSASLPNDIGIQIETGADNNVVGGTTAGEANVIANNTTHGVLVYSNGVQIIDNSIYNNGGVGIELISGANNNQTAPAITSAVMNGGNLVVNYNASASATTQGIRIDFFKADALGQGKTFLFSNCINGNNGSSTTTINAAAIGVSVGDKLVALATAINDANCNLASFGDGTSQFSAAATIACAPPSAQINAPANACPMP